MRGDDVRPEFQNLVLQVLARVDRDSPRACGSRVVLVTSARPGEGKTTIAEGLARHAAALAGERVLLIDANHSAPAVHLRFGLPDAPGLAEHLSMEAVELPIRPDVVPGLDVLTAGARGSRGALLRRGAITRLLDSLRDRYGLIIIDGAVLHVDGRAILAHADGALLVVDAAATRREVVSGTLASLHVPREKVLGVVLNRRARHIPRLLYRFL